MPKLLEQVRRAVRTRNYSPRTIAAYVQWIKRLILFHNKPPEPAFFLSSSPWASALAVPSGRCPTGRAVQPRRAVSGESGEAVAYLSVARRARMASRRGSGLSCVVQLSRSEGKKSLRPLRLGVLPVFSSLFPANCHCQARRRRLRRGLPLAPLRA